MSSVNITCLLGNMTRDVELRFLTSGTAVGSFGMAMNRKYTQNGESKEECTFVDCTVFGKQAETLAKYTKKGSKIHIIGRLKLDTWDDKQTQQKRSKLGVVVESFTFLDSKKQDDMDSNGDVDYRGENQVTPRQTDRKTPPSPDTTPIEEDDVPF